MIGKRRLNRKGACLRAATHRQAKNAKGKKEKKNTLTTEDTENTEKRRREFYHEGTEPALDHDRGTQRKTLEDFFFFPFLCALVP
jgi:hypothetical protein